MHLGTLAPTLRQDNIDAETVSDKEAGVRFHIMHIEIRNDDLLSALPPNLLQVVIASTPRPSRFDQVAVVRSAGGREVSVFYLIPYAVLSLSCLSPKSIGMPRIVGPALSSSHPPTATQAQLS